jgi:hypothetical protein
MDNQSHASEMAFSGDTVYECEIKCLQRFRCRRCDGGHDPRQEIPDPSHAELVFAPRSCWRTLLTLLTRSSWLISSQIVDGSLGPSYFRHPVARLCGLLNSVTAPGVPSNNEECIVPCCSGALRVLC